MVEIMNSQQESDQLRIVDLESGGETKIKEERNDELETIERFVTPVIKPLGCDVVIA